MRITLTDRQVVFLGWDSGNRPRPIRVRGGQWTFDLDDSRIAELRLQAETCGFGCDAADTRTAAALLRKLAKAAV